MVLGLALGIAESLARAQPSADAATGSASADAGPRARRKPSLDASVPRPVGSHTAAGRKRKVGSSVVDASTVADAGVADAGAGDAGMAEADAASGPSDVPAQTAEQARFQQVLREEAALEERLRAEDLRLEHEEAAREKGERQADRVAEQNAQVLATEAVPDFVEALPQPVQNVVTNAVANMVVSRAPPDRFLYSVFGLPRTRFGSGTTWLPDASPLYAAVPHIGRWGLLIHGNLYTGYNWYSSERGWRRFMGRNTLMGSVFRTFLHSELSFRLALSFEPLTIGKRGYPQILQTGQTSNGDRIADRMYALDFFRELAMTYSWEVTREWAATVYLAAAGEPALGPVTFTQRLSASADPLAPLGFQAQEQTHASFGVLTVGAFTRRFKIEASWFNGEVPRVRTYGIYLRKPDSYSVRLNWNPLAQWSLQVSYGFLEHPVQKEPDRSEHRTTASATYTQWRSNGSGISSTASFAERVSNTGDLNTAFMLEAYWNIDGHHSVFGRAELLQKSGKELILPEITSELFAVGSIAAGYVYYFGPFITLAPGLGVRASINPMEDDLSRFYGTQVAYGLMAFAQLRTSALPIDPKPLRNVIDEP